jgi:CheY-like chemotaxis protein
MTKKILLADDSVTIRKVVELTLMEEEYELETVADGREALAALDGGAPDLLVADIHMPEVGGLEVARESKKRYPEVPVLLLVGTFETFDPEDVTACGAEDFLKKPFDSQDLLKKVGLLLASPTAEEEDAPDTDEEGDAVESTELAEPDLEADAVVADSVAESSEVQDETSSAILEAPPGRPLSDGDVDRIARRVAELLTADVIREVAWEVVPDTAEIVIRERLRELEGQVD